MKRQQLPGFTYDRKRKRAVFDGFVPGTKCKVRRQRTIDNVTEKEARAAWERFRDDLTSGRAIQGPLTLRQFAAGYYALISAGYTEGTRKTQGAIIRNHLLRYFGDTELTAITAIRVSDFMKDMRSRPRPCSPSYVNDAVRVLVLLLRQAVEREVIADYPIRKKVKKTKEVPLRLELKLEERARFYLAFEDEDAFRRHLGARQQLGAERPSEHFETPRRFGGGMRGDGAAAGAYFQRFRELREFFIVAVETGLRVWTDLLNLKWSSVDFDAGFIRVVMQKTEQEAEIPISAACRQALQTCQRRAVASVNVFVDARGRRLRPRGSAARSWSRSSPLVSIGDSGRTWRTKGSTSPTSRSSSATPIYLRRRSTSRSRTSGARRSIGGCFDRAKSSAAEACHARTA